MHCMFGGEENMELDLEISESERLRLSTISGASFGRVGLEDWKLRQLILREECYSDAIEEGGRRASRLPLYVRDNARPDLS